MFTMTQKRQGEFELAVLRAIANFGGNGYGVTIAIKRGNSSAETSA